MKIYFAGNAGYLKREREWMRFYKRRLLSYYMIHYKVSSTDKIFKFMVEDENLPSRNSGRRNIQKAQGNMQVVQL